MIRVRMDEKNIQSDLLSVPTLMDGPTKLALVLKEVITNRSLYPTDLRNLMPELPPTIKEAVELILEDVEWN